MKLLLILIAVFLSSTAQAGWRACPGLTTDTGTSIAKIGRDQAMCLRQTTATDPARLDARDCMDGLDLTFQDVTAEDYTASAIIYQCADTGAAAVFTDCKVLSVDRNGDGIGDNLPLTGAEETLQFGVWGLTPDWYAFDITNVNSRTIELKAICR